MKDKIRWGILGLGNIAGKFAKDLMLIDDAELVAVASRNGEKAHAFAQTHKAKKSFDNYEALLEYNDLDIVYIATPHSFHKEQCIMALRAGKHVLCEKPLGLNQEEVKEIIKVASEESRFLMEALWSRFIPAVSEVINASVKGELGPIRYINADFGFYALDRYPEGRLFTPELGGGSLLDIGIYPVFLAYAILGKPLEIEASAHLMQNGVEYQTAMRFTYNQSQAMLFSSLACNTQMRAEIAGENGSFFLEPRWHEADSYTKVTGGEEDFFHFPREGKGYTYEIEEVHRCLRSRKLESSTWSHRDSLNLIGLLDVVASLYTSGVRN